MGWGRPHPSALSPWDERRDGDTGEGQLTPKAETGAVWLQAGSPQELERPGRPLPWGLWRKHSPAALPSWGFWLQPRENQLVLFRSPSLCTVAPGT